MSYDDDFEAGKKAAYAINDAIRKLHPTIKGMGLILYTGSFFAGVTDGDEAKALEGFDVWVSDTRHAIKDMAASIRQTRTVQ